MHCSHEQLGASLYFVPNEGLLPAARAAGGRITQEVSHGARLTRLLTRRALHFRLDTVLELSAVFRRSRTRRATTARRWTHSRRTGPRIHLRAPRRRRRP